MHSTDTTDIEALVTRLAADLRPEGRPKVDSMVAAVIACEGDRRFLPETLSSVLSQSVLPATVVIADCGSPVFRPAALDVDVSAPTTGEEGDPSHTALQTGGRVLVRIVSTAGARSFADATSRALRHAELGPETSALWMLHDDSRPVGPRCLERLLDARSNTPGVGVIGVKQLSWDGKRLHEVGYYAHGHRCETLVIDGERDQEQYDDRRDVFAVSLAGALVPLSALTRFGGIDPWFGTFGESFDFCRRVCRSGGRVLIVPQVAVAHRRARFEGVRSRSGMPLEEGSPRRATMARLVAEQRYRYTDIPLAWWLLVWLMSLPASVVHAVVCLVGKRPYEAWCRLRLPWLAWASPVRAVAARRRLRRHASLPLSRLPMLIVDRRQMSRWRDRRTAYVIQNGPAMAGPLERSHLHRRAVSRFLAAALMALASLAALVMVRIDLLRAAFSGGSLSSGGWLATAADFTQVLRAADMGWFLGDTTGFAMPSTPWMWVWACLSALTLGNMSAALVLLFFLSAPAAALSFWALAGVFTRSDGVRVAGGLVWAGTAALLGLYQSANLAMLTVMVFLPATMAFVFRAVAMYHTEDPRRPHASVQAAACAGLCGIPVVAAEPQLVLAFAVVLIAFLILVRGHRVMLLLIPLPWVLVLAPLLVDSFRGASAGTWRQLFGDVAVPTMRLDGHPSALSLVGMLERAIGGWGSNAFSTRSGMMAASSWIVIGVLTLLSVLALVLPFVLRVSRMMWVVILSGTLLAMVSARIGVGVDSGGVVAGSTLPGVAFMILGLLSCSCMVAGGAVRRFDPLPGASRRGSGNRFGVGPAVVRAARGGLVLLLMACALLWSAYGLARNVGTTATIVDRGLPMIAQDYLGRSAGRRILVLRMDAGSVAEIGVMRTARGDLVDSSPSARVRLMLDGSTGIGSDVSSAVAGLVEREDDDAVARIAASGFGGIYVVTDDSSDSTSKASERLIANITASDGVQVVVSDDAGVYYRLSAAGGSSGMAEGEKRALADPWRRAWLGALVVTGICFLLVAVPTPSKSRRGML
ncbi:glycosyltransferase family 2 protein [uncultured Bifidobacterium sp.]|uniref:glycosyltransferase family 2 protein n=1 Tax=uncultured Bifidobacterium sp. TaxID=165187 RepID=UPI0028DB9A7B|nr:glycosyltransferase family 2 protein [uncultured Bifidobacterium sp.]